MTRGERLERCAKAAYRDFLARVPAIGAVAEVWEDLPPSVQEWWLGEAEVVLRSAARGTVHIRRETPGRVWHATCRHCAWSRYGLLRYVQHLAARHAPQHWLFR